MSLSLQALEDRKNEWKTLINEFRLLEQSRKDFSEDNAIQLRKQRDNIDFLRCENEVLSSEVNNLTRHMNQSHTTLTQQDVLKQIQEASLRYSESIEIEKRVIVNIKESIDARKISLLERQREIGGAFAPFKTEYQINRHYRMLQQRLELQTHKYNALKSQNKTMKEALHNMKKERQAFDNAHRRLDRDVEAKKSRMSEVVENTNASYEQRDAHLLDIAAIEEANRQFKKEFNDKIQSIGRQLECEFKIPRTSSRSFLNQTSMRSSDRLNTHSSSKLTMHDSPSGSPSGLPRINNQRRASLQKDAHLYIRGDSASSIGSPDSSSSVVVDLRRSVDNMLLDHDRNPSSPNTSLIVSHERSHQISSNKLNNIRSVIGHLGITEDKAIALLDHFETAFDRLRTATGIDNPHDVAIAFSESETRCYMLFQFVDEQLREIDRLHGDVNTLVSQRRAISGESGADDSQKLLLLDAGEKSDQEGIIAIASKWEQRNVGMSSAVSRAALRLNTLVDKMKSFLSPHEKTMSSLMEVDSKYNVCTLTIPRELNHVEICDIDVQECLKQVELMVAALLHVSETTGRLYRTPSMRNTNTRIMSPRGEMSGIKYLKHLQPVLAGDSHLLQSQEESAMYSLATASISPTHPASFRIPTVVEAHGPSNRPLRRKSIIALEEVHKPLSKMQIRSEALDAVQTHPLMKQRSLSTYTLHSSLNDC